MNLSMTVNPWQDEHLIFAQQMSSTHILAQAVLPEWSSGMDSRNPGGNWNTQVLAAMRNRVEKAGLTLAGLDALPIRYDRAVLGAAGWEEDLPAVTTFLQNAGEAGIKLVCYRWATSAAHPAGQVPIGRGDAGVRVGSNTHTAAVRDKSSLDRLIKFLDGVLPTAGKAGIRLVYCPISTLTTADILPPAFPADLDDLKLLMSQTASQEHGLDFNTGVIFDLLGAEASQTETLETALRWFDEQGKILLVSAANRLVQSTQTRETFLNEGQINLPRLLRILGETGYAGTIRADSQPVMDGDSAWGHKAQAYSAGYLRAVLQAIR